MKKACVMLTVYRIYIKSLILLITNCLLGTMFLSSVPSTRRVIFSLNLGRQVPLTHATDCRCVPLTFFPQLDRYCFPDLGISFCMHMHIFICVSVFVVSAVFMCMHHAYSIHTTSQSVVSTAIL